jgi:hypothetical protein
MTFSWKSETWPILAFIMVWIWAAFFLLLIEVITVVVFTVERKRDQAFLDCILYHKVDIFFFPIHDTFLDLSIFIRCLLFISGLFWLWTCGCLSFKKFILQIEDRVLLVEILNLPFALRLVDTLNGEGHACCDVAYGRNQENI